jgi:hypothetical protein
VLRHSSAGARTAGPRTDRRSVACAARVRRGGGEARGTGQSRRLGSGDGLGKARDLGRQAASARVASGVDAEGGRARGRGARPTRICVADPLFERE